MTKVFIASDLHGKFDELWELLIKDGFIPGDDEYLAILNGDIIDAYDSYNEQISQLEIIKSNIDKYKNIIYIKGNHEAQIKLKDNAWQAFLEQLPVAYVNDRLFICHGWFNPYWSIAEHHNKIVNDDFNVANFGDIYHGSPQNIMFRERLNKNYFEFSSFKQYEDTLLEMYPEHKFIYGHYFNFLWSYEKCGHMHYFIYREELDKLEKNLPNLITEMIEEFDYSKPYISPNKKIYCIDVFTKCYKNKIPHYFCILQFDCDVLGRLYYEDGNSMEFNI